MIYELAGVLGIDPNPLTLRELYAMADARVRYDWNHTAALLAMQYNAARDPKRSSAKSAFDFHPCPPAGRRRKPSHTTSDLSFLKAFCPDAAETPCHPPAESEPAEPSSRSTETIIRSAAP